MLDGAHRSGREPVEPEAGQHDLELERIQIVEEVRPCRVQAHEVVVGVCSYVRWDGQPASLGHESSAIQESEPAMGLLSRPCRASSTAVFGDPTLDERNL